MSIMRVTQLDTILFTSKPEASGENLYLVGVIFLSRIISSSNRKIAFSTPINQRSKYVKQQKRWDSIRERSNVTALENLDGKNE